MANVGWTMGDEVAFIRNVGIFTERRHPSRVAVAEYRIRCLEGYLVALELPRVWDSRNVSERILKEEAELMLKCARDELERVREENAQAVERARRMRAKGSLETRVPGGSS